MRNGVQAAPLLPPPIELGAPERFDRWRVKQDKAVLDIMASDKRFVFCAMPTGAGKSLTSVVQQLLCGGRLAYLTSTKALQQQLMDDFEVSGLVQVKGQNSYVCRLAAEDNYFEGGRTVMVDGGACHAGYFCRYMDGGCGYFDAVNTARNRNLVVTNYSFFMTQYAYGEGLGKFDMLVCDEGHHAERCLTSFLAFAFDQADAGRVKHKLLSPGTKLEKWKEWGGDNLLKVRGRLESRQQEIKELQDNPEMQRKIIRNILREIKDLKDLAKRLEALTDAEGDWVIDHRDTYVEFTPLQPSRYAEKFLFLGIKKIICMSATLTTKDADRLGIKAEDMDYFEYPSTFPIKNRPIYRIPTVSVKYDTSESDMKKWDTRIDQIVESRLDRKGIIHSNSFKLAKRIQQNSKWADVMFFNTSENTRAMVEKFKNADPPAVLVSPSISTGFDFPDCVGPDTRVLKSNLHWVRAGDLKIGDHLVGFDEKPRPGSAYNRQWRDSIITALSWVKRPTHRIYFDDGTTIDASDTHGWLVVDSAASHAWRRTYGHVASGQRFGLRAGGKIPSKLCRFMRPWSTALDAGSAYLAAAWDGEGSLYQSLNPRTSNRTGLPTQMANNALVFTQAYNPMLMKVIDLLIEKHFAFDIYSKQSERTKPPHHKDVVTLRIRHRADMLRFLGEIRPERILPKFQVDLLGSVKRYREEPFVRVEHIEDLGQRELVAFSTSTKTFIAEGFGSHNSECRYQIIAKVPFPNTDSAVIKAWRELDPDYAFHLAMQTITQAYGRGNRSEHDFCECFVVDNNFGWFVGQYGCSCGKPLTCTQMFNKKPKRHFAPKYFLDAIIWCESIPKAPKLEE